MEFDHTCKKNRNEVIEKFYYFFNIIEEKKVLLTDYNESNFHFYNAN